jgi:hypothetical protein
MPKPYPAVFRRKALDLVESGRSVREVAATLGIAESCLHRWRSHDLIAAAAGRHHAGRDHLQPDQSGPHRDRRPTRDGPQRPARRQHAADQRRRQPAPLSGSALRQDEQQPFNPEQAAAVMCNDYPTLWNRQAPVAIRLRQFSAGRAALPEQAYWPFGKQATSMSDDQGNACIRLPDHHGPAHPPRRASYIPEANAPPHQPRRTQPDKIPGNEHTTSTHTPKTINN